MFFEGQFRAVKHNVSGMINLEYMHNRYDERITPDGMRWRTIYDLKLMASVTATGRQLNWPVGQPPVFPGLGMLLPVFNNKKIFEGDNQRRRMTDPIVSPNSASQPAIRLTDTDISPLYASLADGRTSIMQHCTRMKWWRWRRSCIPSPRWFI